VTIDETLSVLRPSPDETALLAACLHTGQCARDAWARWRSSRDAADDMLGSELAPTRSLLPLLARSVMRNRLDVEARVLAHVRAAVLHEELRAGRFRQIAAEMLAALERAGACAFVTRGAALAATVYGDWSLRHCHDLDLLVPAEHLADAAGALSERACVPIGSRAATGALLRHASGLQIALHTRPFAVAFYDVALDGFVESAQSIIVEGVPARTLSPEAMLVHVLGHATYSSRRGNLRWVTDAWHLLARHPDINWSDIAARLDACRITLPVSILLAYLAGFGMPVPPELVERVRQRASAAAPVAQDVALGGALAARSGDLRSLWRSSGSWRSRARFARWMLAPMPGYVRSAFPATSAWLVPLCYLYRPFRFIAGRLARRRARAPVCARVEHRRWTTSTSAPAVGSAFSSVARRCDTDRPGGTRRPGGS
jgi:Uncharacterised nucleotidyltransferase